MNKGLLWSLTALLASTGLVLAQSPVPAELPAVSQPLTLRAAEQPNADPMTDGMGAPMNGDQAGATDCPHIKRPAPPIWVSAEYLLWWIRNTSFPALVTSGPPSSGGIITNPGTVVVAGDGVIDYHTFSGGRISAGFWFDPDERLGVEGTFLFLGSRNFHFGAVSPTGQPIIARPFFDTNVGLPDAELIAFPNTVSANIDVTSSSRMMGGEVNGVFNLGSGKRSHFDFLLGFRYLELDEDLSITQDMHVDPNFNVILPTGQPLSPPVSGERIRMADSFGTDNSFYGVQLGARAQFWAGNFFGTVLAKVALGGVNQAIDVNGMTAELNPLRPFVHAGGVLAVPSNMGHFGKDKFAVVPEVGANVGYQLNRHWRVFGGYNFLYWNSVARPGPQLNTNVNGQQIPLNNLGNGPIVGPISPTFNLHDSQFWAQGVNFGIEFIF